MYCTHVYHLPLELIRRPIKLFHFAYETTPCPYYVVLQSCLPRVCIFHSFVISQPHHA